MKIKDCNIISHITSEQFIRNIKLHILSDIELEEPIEKLYNEIVYTFEYLHNYKSYTDYINSCLLKFDKPNDKNEYSSIPMLQYDIITRDITIYDNKLFEYIPSYTILSDLEKVLQFHIENFILPHVN